MNSISNDYFDFSNMELGPTVGKAVLATATIAFATFLGYQAYQYVREAAQQSLREKIADYIVIGCTRDHKLSDEELAVKGEALAIRRRLCALFNEITKENIPNLSEQQRKDLHFLSSVATAGFALVDDTSKTQAEATLPMWWKMAEGTIRAQIKENIQIRYSNDPMLEPKKLELRNNLKKQIDAIVQKVIRKNSLCGLIALTLEGYTNSIKNKL